MNSSASVVLSLECSVGFKASGTNVLHVRDQSTRKYISAKSQCLCRLFLDKRKAFATWRSAETQAVEMRPDQEEGRGRMS